VPLLPPEPPAEAVLVDLAVPPFELAEEPLVEPPVEESVLVELEPEPDPFDVPEPEPEPEPELELESDEAPPPLLRESVR
jgi:hypothetical protein